MTLTVQGAILPILLPPEPSFTVWSRLEPLPLSADLRPGLQARVADPLWLLGRQWQFGELQGEDAGSPVETRVRGERVALTRYAPGPLDEGTPERARDHDGTLPLEVLVEREPAHATHPRLAAEAGLHFLRCLVAEGGESQRARYLASSLTMDAVAVEDGRSDPDGAAWAMLLNGRALDGRKLAASFRPLTDENDQLTALPDEPSVPKRFAVRVRRAAERWLRWYDQAVREPADGPESWNSARQEYAFSLSADVPEGPVVLAADEYRDGRLDWYSFRAHGGPSLRGVVDVPSPGDVADGASPGGVADGAQPEAVVVPPLLPTPVRYPGMPADRYWEFEDARVNLAEIQAGRTDLLQLLLVEFALAYGNDWFLVPLTLPVGSLFRMTSCIVRDTFGVETTIGRSRDSDGTPWTVFELSRDPAEPAYLRDFFFLAPTLPVPLAGDSLEEVALFRDEMANLCWGVERKVQGPAGNVVDRYLEASHTPVHQRLVDPPDDARLVYRLATPVPANWIPFVPVRATVEGDPAGVQLERRVLQRFDATGSGHGVQPRGLLLRSDPSHPPDAEAPLRLHEEEVPREGAVVRRMFQHARGPNGESYLWLGRDKRVGTGEGASLLRFDVAER